MGYQVRLLLDGSEQIIRQEISRFASDSEKADVALVFYAGHGAQVNGSNYLLPTDIDIPRTEVDIQFSGLKVDDIINGVRSNTKIVFLDACRDNPALFKNLVKGRAAHPQGSLQRRARISIRNLEEAFSLHTPPTLGLSPMMVPENTALLPKRYCGISKSRFPSMICFPS